jgi:DNA helicase-2/ATP-dependent DNA helicase PcrA
MDFEPSVYQKKIFDFITNGVGNAVINAKAGSGKTTTLVEAMKLIPSKDKVLFVAFNKAIEEELANRLKGYSNVDVRTYHGLGFAILRHALGKKVSRIRVNEYKYTTFINNNLYLLSPDIDLLNKNDLRVFKSNLKQLVDFARFNLAQSHKEISDLCKKYGITPMLNECDATIKILEWGKSNTYEIDYTDMIWLCIELGLRPRTFKYDYIFIDEAQDSSIVQQSLIKKCFKRGTRFIAVGDDFQCINAFAGADQDAFIKLQNEPNTIILDLPITYRCPKSIVEFVKLAVGVDIEANDNAIEGEIRYDVNPYDPKNNDMVLCRNTAHLVKLYMKYNRINKKSYLKGRNIGEQFKTLILQTNKDYLSKDMMSDGVFPRLYERLFDAINKEISVTGMEYEDVVNTRTIADLIDSIKALEALSDGIVWKDDLIEKINTIFTDDSKDGVCLSTIHKSKGLEADNVYILCPSLMPSKHARQKWEIIAEDNLMYVAITRAKKTLNYISEKLFPANLFGDNDDIVSELEYQRKKMNKVLNTNSSALRNIDLTTEERVSIDAKRIMNTKNSKTRIVNEKKRNSIGGNKMSKFLK